MFRNGTPLRRAISARATAWSSLIPPTRAFTPPAIKRRAARSADSTLGALATDTATGSSAPGQEGPAPGGPAHQPVEGRLWGGDAQARGSHHAHPDRVGWCLAHHWLRAGQQGHAVLFEHALDLLPARGYGHVKGVSERGVA